MDLAVLELKLLAGQMLHFGISLELTVVLTHQIDALSAHVPAELHVIPFYHHHLPRRQFSLVLPQHSSMRKTAFTIYHSALSIYQEIWFRVDLFLVFLNIFIMPKPPIDAGCEQTPER